MTAPPAGALEACPCCGGEAATNTARTTERDYIRLNKRDTGYGVNCISCGLNNRGIALGYATEAEAIAAWNRRTPGPALLAALRLREGVEQAWTELRLVACDLQLLRPNEPLSVAGRKHYAERINATADDLARVLEEGE